VRIQIQWYGFDMTEIVPDPSVQVPRTLRSLNKPKNSTVPQIVFRDQKLLPFIETFLGHAIYSNRRLPIIDFRQEILQIIVESFELKSQFGLVFVNRILIFIPAVLLVSQIQ